MLLILGTGVGATLLGITLGYIVGLRRGRQDKMEELLALQEEGWLTITYMGEQQQSSQQQLPKSLHTYTHGIHDDDDKDIASLLYGDDAKEIARPRRDSGERRDDWAHAIRATQEAHDVLHDGDDEPHDD